uniref:VP4 n=1 Tax=Emberiza spodocephala ambidensovirus TaxID=2794446 RepID=A0A8A4XCY0_9VIRU|nr:MAG: VP4 [Emberiza spodocephala ambidensovirus]
MPRSPANPTHHYGQERYGLLQKAYSTAWRRLSAAEKRLHGNYNSWRKSVHGREVKDKFNRDWISGVFTRGTGADTSDNGRAPDPVSGPSHRADDNPSPFDVEELFRTVDWDNFPDPDMADIQNNLPEAPTASSVAAGGATEEPMDTAQLGSTGGGPGRGGTASAAPSGIAKICPNPQLKTMHISFSKKWFKYTYGYAHNIITGTQLNRLFTPYAYYPVDWVPWYISPQEYCSLPMNSKIVHVSCDIHLLGTRTAFDHGTTLSGTATTEYVPIIKYVTGLNNKVYIDNRPIEVNMTEPMMPQKVKNKSLQEQFTVMYNTAGALEIPRHLNWYASILYNKTSDKYDGVDTYVNYRLDKVLWTGLANKCMDSAIINYSFKPTNGYIKPTKKMIIPMYNKEDGFADDINPNQVLYKHTIPHVMKITPLGGEERGRVQVSAQLEKTDFNYSNRIDNNYYQSVEGYTFLHVHSGQHSNFRNQPQVHLGLLATPALNPGAETANFLNSSIYTVTYAKCDVEFDMESMCVSGGPYEWPEDVKLFIDKARGYTGYGAQLLGVAATASGRLESERHSRRAKRGGVSGGSTQGSRRVIDYPPAGTSRAYDYESTGMAGRGKGRGLGTKELHRLSKRLARTGIDELDDILGNPAGSGNREVPGLSKSCESEQEFDLYAYESFEDISDN